MPRQRQSRKEKDKEMRVEGIYSPSIIRKTYYSKMFLNGMQTLNY
nr:MAG TPA: hypothetical protein [Caudoviricetes sp.]